MMTESPYPTIRWLRSQFRHDLYASRRLQIQAAYIIGSEAKGTAKPDSDLDIAIVIPAIRGKTSLRYTENYHAKFPSDASKPHWQGRRLDYQFYYPGELPDEYDRLLIP